MALQKPLVIIGGQIQELPAGDDLNASAVGGESITMSNASAGPVTLGQLMYISGADAVDLAQANAAGTQKAVGMVSEASIAAAATGKIQTDGFITSTDWTPVAGSATLTPGAEYFLSASTAGQMTATAPSAAGEYVRRVGVAKSATDFLLEIDQSVLKS